MINSLNQRLLRRQLPHLEDDCEDTLCFDILDDELRSWFETTEVIYCSQEEWISKQKTGVKDRQRALREFDSVRHSSDIYGEHRAHLKTEKQIVQVDGKLVPRNERLILGAGDEENADLGKYITTVQHSLVQHQEKDLENGVISPYFTTCGMNLVRAGQVIQMFYELGYILIYCFDKSAFDATVSGKALAFERLVYTLVFAPNDRVKRALISQTNRRVSCANGVRVTELLNRRGSGDPNTTCGNTIICGCTTRYTLRHLGIQDHVIFSTGDDMLVMTKTPLDIAAFVEHQRQQFGFVNRVVGPCSPANVDFLSCRLLPAVVGDHEQWVLSPLIGKCLVKAFWTVSLYARIYPSRVARAVCKSLRCLFSADPIALRFVDFVQQSYGDGPVANTKHIPTYGITYLFDANAPDFGPSDDYYDWNHDRYGQDLRWLMEVPDSWDNRQPVQPYSLPTSVVNRDGGV
jgi:hypothetical protein